MTLQIDNELLQADVDPVEQNKHITNNFVERVKRWAIKQHGKQMYGSHPYSKHLHDVAYNVATYSYLLPPNQRALALVLAYCHDLFEDTKVTEQEAIKQIGVDATEKTKLLTNYWGKDKNKTIPAAYFENMAHDAVVVFVKLCDRLANINEGIKTHNPKARTYAFEQGKLDLCFEMYKEDFAPIFKAIHQLID